MSNSDGISNDEIRELQEHLSQNKKNAPGTKPFKHNISPEQIAPVREAVIEYVTEFDADTVTAGQLSRFLPDHERSHIGTALARICEDSDLLEETPFNPIGGRRYHVHPEETK